MKKILLPLTLMAVMLVASCNTTQKLFEAQQYDQVIQREAPKVCAGQTNPNKIGLIAASYHRANQADHERIQALKASGQPEVWPEIYERFCSMKGRNQALACFPRKVKNDIQYTTLQLDEELKAAKNKAEAYLTAKLGQTLDGEQPDLEETDRMIRRLQELNPENTRLNEFKVRSLAKRYGDLSRIMHVDVLKRQVSPNRDETVAFKETPSPTTPSPRPPPCRARCGSSIPRASGCSCRCLSTSAPSSTPPTPPWKVRRKPARSRPWNGSSKHRSPSRPTKA